MQCPAFSVCLNNGCTNRITSTVAEQVTLYKDEALIPDHCKRLGEVAAGVYTSTRLCPTELMINDLREKVLLITIINGVRVL